MEISQKVRKDSLGLLDAIIYSEFYVFLKFNPSNLCREATLATLSMIRALKVMTHNIKALYMAFIGTSGFIF